MKAPSFWYKSVTESRCVRLLLPLSRCYRALVQRRATRPAIYQSSLPVICVGNIVLGGSGKTPVVQSIVQMLQQQGKTPAVLMRGYGGRLKRAAWVDPQVMGAADCGDEALLHARYAPVVVAADRVAGARLIERRKPPCDVIVMDDGLQNHALAKRLSLVVLDGRNPVGNGQVFPAGPLRETLEDALKRADALVILGDDRHDLETRYGFGLPVFRAALEPENPDDFRDKRLVAFAGIGQPEKFFASLQQSGGRIVTRRAFADHHQYSKRTIARLLDDARRHDAIAVTTRKDWVRLSDRDKPQVSVLDVRLRWEKPEEILRFILNKD